MTPEKLYLDLLKKTLSFALWPEPPVPVDMFNSKRAFYVRWPVSLSTRLLRHTRFKIVHDRRFKAEHKERGMYWPAYAHTMIGLRRLNSLQECVEAALREGVDGDLIETGVWRGGACVLMRGVLAAFGDSTRKVFVADSFEGLPEPDAERCPADKGADFHTHPALAVSLEEVKGNFRRYGLLDQQVIFLKGWFKETLPNAPIKALAVMRLDGDMYESTVDALTHLYPKLSPGGFCIVDDYDLPGCKQAVDRYRAENLIDAPIVTIDQSGVYWRKPLSVPPMS